MTDAPGRTYYVGQDPQALYVIDNSTHAQWVWQPDTSWITTDVVGQYKFFGEPDLDEITEPDARKRYSEAFRVQPGGEEDRMDPDELTVEESSSLAARATNSDNDFDTVAKESEIPPNRMEHAKYVWDSTRKTQAAMKPGEQMMLPNEWS